MGRVKAVPRDVIKAVPKGVSNVKKVFDDVDSDSGNEKVEEVKIVAKKGKKAVVAEVSTEINTTGKKKGKQEVVESVSSDSGITKKGTKKGKKTVDDDAPEEISAKDNEEIRRLKEWHESLITGNKKIKKQKTKKESCSKVDPTEALDLSVLEAYTQYNDTNMSDEMSDEEDLSPVQKKVKKIDKTARSKQVGNLQVTYIDPKVNDPFAVYHVSSSAIEFTKTIKDSQPRVRYAVFRAQKNGGPAKVFKR